MVSKPPTDYGPIIARLRECRASFYGEEIDAADALVLIGKTFGDRPFTTREFGIAVLDECARRRIARIRWWNPATWKYAFKPAPEAKR